MIVYLLSLSGIGHRERCEGDTRSVGDHGLYGVQAQQEQRGQGIHPQPLRRDHRSGGRQRHELTEHGCLTVRKLK